MRKAELDPGCSWVTLIKLVQFSRPFCTVRVQCTGELCGVNEIIHIIGLCSAWFVGCAWEEVPALL